MTSNTTRIGLPYLQASQSDKHVTVNEAFRLLDAHVQLAVRSRLLATQPATPDNGDLYILPVGRTGTFWGAITPLSIVQWRDDEWAVITPKAGWRAIILDEQTAVTFFNNVWKKDSEVPLNQPVAAAGQNLLINPDFSVNQRNFGGGSLANNVFGYDRWKAASAGTSIIRQANGSVVFTGKIAQTIERPQVVGSVVTFSICPSPQALTVQFGSSTVALAPSTSRRSVSFQVSTADVANPVFSLEASAACEIAVLGIFPKLERGALATECVPRAPAEELGLCQRYYEQFIIGYGGPAVLGQAAATFGQFKVTKRAVPTLTWLSTLAALRFPSTAPLQFLTVTTANLFIYKIANDTNHDARYHELYAIDAEL